MTDVPSGLAVDETGEYIQTSAGDGAEDPA